MIFPASTAMAAALIEAVAAANRGEVPVGAAITDSAGQIVTVSGNRTRELSDPTAHAEIIAIRSACSLIGSERLVGYSLYVTLEPCAMCAAAIGFARIKRIFYGAPDPKGGGVDHGARVFSHQTSNHQPEVFSGIGETAAATLLRDFFERRRIGR